MQFAHGTSNLHPPSRTKPQDVFNMDETGLYWMRAPKRTLSDQRRSGQKVAKERITIALMANADGSEKLKPLCINTAETPRAFLGARVGGPRSAKQRWEVKEHVYWEFNPKAWMNSVVFERFMTVLNSRFKRENRQVHLCVRRGAAGCPWGKLFFLWHASGVAPMLHTAFVCADPGARSA